MENTNNQDQIITIADLDMLKQIIDVSCARGVFKGEELSQVGAVYNKLSNFLNLAIAQAQQESAPVEGQAEGEGQATQESQAGTQTQGE